MDSLRYLQKLLLYYVSNLEANYLRNRECLTSDKNKCPNEYSFLRLRLNTSINYHFKILLYCHDFTEMHKLKYRTHSGVHLHHSRSLQRDRSKSGDFWWHLTSYCDKGKCKARQIHKNGANHSFLVYKLSLSVANYSLRTVNFS